jgi:hypothetical protein
MCVVHFHGHWNKMVPLMKVSILADLNSDIKFRNCTYWLINDTQHHHLPCWVDNYYIDNEDLVLPNHVKVG